MAAKPQQPLLNFSAASRLHRRIEFRRVQRSGVRFQTDHFVVYAALFPESPTVRLGTAISRRLGNAVIRNRVKRRIRECFRIRLRSQLPAGTALVVIGRAGAGILAMRPILGELEAAIAKLRPRLLQGHE